MDLEMALAGFIVGIFLLAASTSPQPNEGVSLPPLQYPASLHELQFFNSKTGSYFFQYDTGSNGPASFRGERRDAAGTVTGYFGYIDPDGVLRLTHYKADSMGYRASTTLRYLQTEAPVNKHSLIEPE